MEKLERTFTKADSMSIIAQVASYVNALDDKEYTLTIQERKKKRSLNANALFWELCGKLAAKTGEPMKEVYRHYIKEIGGNFDVICIQDKALDHFRKLWEVGHIGRFTETDDSKLNGCTNVIVYYGSSDYDTKTMSRLISMVKQDCEEQGIITYDQSEIDRICAKWGVK